MFFCLFFLHIILHLTTENFTFFYQQYVKLFIQLKFIIFM